MIVFQVTFRTPSPPKEKPQKISPSHKKTSIQTKQVKSSVTDLKVAQVNKGKEKQKEKEEEVKQENTTLAQQQKLLEVLMTRDKPDEKKKKTDSPEKIASGKPKDSEPSKTEQTQQKQQLLSALFDDTKANPQPQGMSGLLNLSKQQQELLSSSKQPSVPARPQPSAARAPAPPQPNAVRAPAPPQTLPPRLQTSARQDQQRVVEKMEAARKEYEDAMFVLQQRKQEQPDMMRYPGKGVWNSAPEVSIFSSSFHRQSKSYK